MDLGRKVGWFGDGEGVFLGGKVLEGRLVWLDGTTTDFTFWGEISKENPVSKGGCLAIFSSLVWVETSCMVETEGEVEDLVICKSPLNHGVNVKLLKNENSIVLEDFWRKFLMVNIIFFTIIFIKMTLIVLVLCKMAANFHGDKK